MKGMQSRCGFSVFSELAVVLKTVQWWQRSPA